MRTKLTLALGTAAISMLAIAGSAFAAAPAYDLAPVATPFSDEITGVLTTVLPIAGGLLALMVGWKVFKRFARG
jgi:hypothetical protein